MQIVFNDQIDSLDKKYTVLELDTIRYGESGPKRTAYCVVNTIPLGEMSEVDGLKKVHSHLMENYRNQEWDKCIEAINTLVNKWGGELDSFYSTIQHRIHKFQTNPPGTDWDATITKI